MKIRKNFLNLNYLKLLIMSKTLNYVPYYFYIKNDNEKFLEYKRVQFSRRKKQ